MALRQKFADGGAPRSAAAFGAEAEIAFGVGDECAHRRELVVPEAAPGELLERRSAVLGREREDRRRTGCSRLPRRPRLRRGLRT